MFIDVAGTTDRLLEVRAASGADVAQMGDLFAAPAGRKIAVEVRVVGAAGGRLRLAGDAKGLAARRRRSARPIRRLSFELTADGAARWLRVDVLGPDGKLILLGNPVYLRP